MPYKKMIYKGPRPTVLLGQAKAIDESLKKLDWAVGDLNENMGFRRPITGKVWRGRCEAFEWLYGQEPVPEKHQPAMQRVFGWTDAYAKMVFSEKPTLKVVSDTPAIEPEVTPAITPDSKIVADAEAARVAADIYVTATDTARKKANHDWHIAKHMYKEARLYELALKNSSNLKKRKTVR